MNCIFGFTQHQDKTDTIYSTGTVIIQPPLDAIWDEIYCYCVEYIEAVNVDRKDAVWKSVCVIPEVNKKGKYIATSCLLTGLTPKKFYAVRVYAFYCAYGYLGYGKYGTMVALRITPQNALVTIDCGPLDASYDAKNEKKSGKE